MNGEFAIIKGDLKHQSISGESHGRSKSTLIPLLALSAMPLNAMAQASTSPSMSITDKLIVSIAAVLIAQAVIPLVKYALNRHSIHRSYIAYLTKILIVHSLDLAMR